MAFKKKGTVVPAEPAAAPVTPKLDLPTPVGPSSSGASARALGGNDNDVTTIDQRTPAVRSSVTPGPAMGAAGEYLPSAYTVTKKMSQGRGQPQVSVTLLRENR